MSDPRWRARRFERVLSALASALLLAFGCESPQTREEPTGGETHFLSRCDRDPQACSSALACLCGVCTLPCDERGACAGFPVAECVASAGSCGSAPVSGHCDVSCASDADCRLLSSSHHCEDGACRAADEPASSGGAGGAGGADPAACAEGEVAANQVLIVGDSFFASSHQITAYLEDLARSGGALSPGERYRDGSRLTANGLAFGGSGILDQYAAAAADSAVSVVIMNAGGTDVLLGSCDPPDSSCATLSAAAAALDDLFARFARDGVEHVVYAFYPDPVDAAVRARMDAWRPVAESACASAGVACAWLDLRPVFAGHYADFIQADGLNPTALGSQASAAAIWQLMQARCIAQ